MVLSLLSIKWEQIQWTNQSEHWNCIELCSLGHLKIAPSLSKTVWVSSSHKHVLPSLCTRNVGPGWNQTAMLDISEGVSGKNMSVRMVSWSHLVNEIVRSEDMQAAESHYVREGRLTLPLGWPWSCAKLCRVSYGFSFSAFLVPQRFLLVRTEKWKKDVGVNIGEEPDKADSKTNVHVYMYMHI